MFLRTAPAQGAWNSLSIWHWPAHPLTAVKNGRGVFWAARKRDMVQKPGFSHCFPVLDQHLFENPTVDNLPWFFQDLGLQGIYIYISGWWLNHPSEKYESKWESSPIFEVKIKNIWNHHPDIHQMSALNDIHGIWHEWSFGSSSRKELVTWW